MLFAFCTIMCLAQEVTITKVQQRYPWNGLVDIEFEVPLNLINYPISFVATNVVTKEEIIMNTFLGCDGNTIKHPFVFSSCKFHVLWNSINDYPNQNNEPLDINVKGNVIGNSTSNFSPLYMVIDLSAGPDADSYPVQYLNDVPPGGFNDEYRTTKLVLRKITAGKMPRTDVDITLTNDYYIAVYELTRYQYCLIMGGSETSQRPKNISYNTIRGSSNGSKWPASNAVDASSFMGKLRAKTGIDFDLPTEAQWEYACRAGSSGKYGFELNGKELSSFVAGGNYNSTSYDVGTKEPNAWGLYDMHGNDWEWCLDWYSSSNSSYTGLNPKGPSSGDSRVLKGGNHYSSLDMISTHGVNQLQASYRYYLSPSSNGTMVGATYPAIRLTVTLTN